MKIDIFTHVMPERYRKAIGRYTGPFEAEMKVQEKRPALTDEALRMTKLAPYEDLVQVISATMPPLELLCPPKEAAELARICNDEMAEMVARRPERYIAAIANLPMNDVDAALRETERAVKELGFRGVQIYAPTCAKPLSAGEFMPLYELMTKLDLPIWIHPYRNPTTSDYATEATSSNQLFSIFGWPYETTAAMARLVFSGVFERYPTVKFITHHCGGMVPYFADRLAVHYDNGLERLGAKNFPGLTKPVTEYFRMFYADTALDGGAAALRCGLEYFGEDHVLFGSDMPYDIENGGVSIRQTIAAIEEMGLSGRVKRKIYEGNARRLLHLD
ncbi:MAG: amidohydrolase [Deltaproteobacteria bacterium]|nr:amidohydrolase [Deltaproteobacteria bacterium]